MTDAPDNFEAWVDNFEAWADVVAEKLRDPIRVDPARLARADQVLSGYRATLGQLVNELVPAVAAPEFSAVDTVDLITTGVLTLPGTMATRPNLAAMLAVAIIELAEHRTDPR